MHIVVDTSVWSAVLRRRQVDESDSYVGAFRTHLARGDSLLLVGPIIQELLSGLKRPEDFNRVVEGLNLFPLIPLRRSTYVMAARLSNDCQRVGVQAGQIDALIAATCIEGRYPLLTADLDLLRIAKHCELIVLPPLNKG